MPGDVWWSISGAALRDALRQAHDGTDPELVYMELYANSDSTEDYCGEGE